MTTNHLKGSQSEKSVLVDNNSSDISYYNEKHKRPNKKELDRELMRYIFKEEIETFELPTQLHQLEK
jgi:bifunctional ADP-heptose synthase (sugar kinase/adenylyltransferase)